MRRAPLMPILFALGGGLMIVPNARAGNADPLVISGVGPDVVQSHPAPAANPNRVAAAGGGLGGGFIEFLATGGGSRSADLATQPVMPRAREMPPVRRAYTSPDPRSEPVAPHAPAMQRAYADPMAQPQSSVHREIEPRFMRQEVEYSGSQPVGSIIVDTPNRYLYLVTGPGRAIRYGIGVGRPGFEWAGIKTVSRKAEWPGWTPPPEMLLRRPDLPKHMDGGPENPLGARALYLGSSMYRIHGTNEPWTIGQNVSSGCIRMMNDDVIDLYGRVKVGTRVQVI